MEAPCWPGLLRALALLTLTGGQGPALEESHHGLSAFHTVYTHPH